MAEREGGREEEGDVHQTAPGEQQWEGGEGSPDAGTKGTLRRKR